MPLSIRYANSYSNPIQCPAGTPGKFAVEALHQPGLGGNDNPVRSIMMNRIFIGFVAMVILIYGSINYYIAIRGWQAIAPYFRFGAWVWVWSIAILAGLPLVARFAGQALPDNLTRILMFMGSYWMAAWYYFLLIFVTIDLLRIIVGILPMLSINWEQWRLPVFIGSCVLLCCLLIYGTWNAWHPVVKEYNLVLPKKNTPLNKLDIAMVSDIHLGWIVGVNRLSTMVNMVNGLHPDLVLLVGDIIDEGVDLESEQDIPEVLRRLNSRYGSFAVLGNHEYISGQADELSAYLKAGNVTLLCDAAVSVDSVFYLIGRDDRSQGSQTGGRRQELSELIKGIEPSALPVILMDHEPFNLEEARINQVDLQFSGHTHLGQIAPNQYITRAVYENDWGYLRKGSLQVLVSCGFGTWGPPIRIGNRPEVLLVHIRFLSP